MTTAKRPIQKSVAKLEVKTPSVSQSAIQLQARVRSILAAAHDTIARSINSAQVVANWLIGREIVEQEQVGQGRANYGAELLIKLSERLQKEHGKGYGVDNLELCRKFYLVYPSLLSNATSISDAVRRKFDLQITDSQISDAVRRKSGATKNTWQAGLLSTDLAWTHYRRLIRIERESERHFYEIEAIKNAWSARELERQVSSLLFDRLAKSRDKKGLMKLATQGHEIAHIFDTLKDPMVLEFLDLPISHRLVENDLEKSLINNLQSFLLELGRGFAFVARQERITLDGDHFYIDLVFYHTVLKCYVLIDLKVGKLSHADLGQTQLYVNYFDEHRRSTGDQPTVGLILCSDKNDAVVKYTLGEQLKRNIFANRYQLHLPTEEELRNEIQREMRFLVPPKKKTIPTKKSTKARKP